MECGDVVKAVSILPGSKNNNNNNHMAACRAVIKVLFSFQQGFTSRVMVSHLEKVNVHNCLGPAGQQESAWMPSMDHMITPHTLLDGEDAGRSFSASLESWPGDFSGNQQPAATSPVGEVVSWQPAFQ